MIFIEICMKCKGAGMRNSNKKHSYFYPYIRLIKLMFKTIPGEMTVYCLADVFHALSIVLAMYGMQLLIDGAEEIYYGKPTNSIIVPLILFIALNIPISCYPYL